MLKYKARKLVFPTGGVNRRRGFEMQPPYTTPVALNVFPDSQENGRERGGSRPGLVKALPAQLAGSINMMHTLKFTSDGTRDDAIVAAAGGNLYRRFLDEVDWTEVTTDLTIATDTYVQATAHFEKLYIADYSTSPLIGTDGVTNASPGTTLTSATFTDWEAESVNANDYVVVVRSTGTGTEGVYTIASVSGGNIVLDSSPGASLTGIHFFVERAPKVYDPAADTLTLWETDSSASDDFVPIGNPCIATWRERVILGGGHDNPHAGFASRSGNAHNFDYGAADDLMAFAWTDNEQVQEPITAIIPHHNDCLLFGCEDSLWAFRGDPAHGGSLTNLSLKIGVLGPAAKAWCKTAEKSTVILSKDGVYVITDPCGNVPESISREKLPDELLNLDTTTLRVLLEYDRRFRGVHIYNTSVA